MDDLAAKEEEERTSYFAMDVPSMMAALESVVICLGVPKIAGKRKRWEERGRRADEHGRSAARASGRVGAITNIML